jgi:hypothetical protein
VDFVSIHRWASIERSGHFRQHCEPEGAPNAGGSIESFRAKKTLNRKPHLVEDRFKSPKPECGDCKKLRPLSRSGLDRPRPDNGEDHPSALRNSSRFGPALVRGRSPAETHYSPFAQPCAPGYKVGDEFTASMCHVRHCGLHRHGGEAACWKKRQDRSLADRGRLWHHARSNDTIVTSKSAIAPKLFTRPRALLSTARQSRQQGIRTARTMRVSTRASSCANSTPAKSARVS